MMDWAITCAAGLACSGAGTGMGPGMGTRTFWFGLGTVPDPDSQRSPPQLATGPLVKHPFSHGSGTGNRPHCFFLCWPRALGLPPSLRQLDSLDRLPVARPVAARSRCRRIRFRYQPLCHINPNLNLNLNDDTSKDLRYFIIPKS